MPPSVEIRKGSSLSDGMEISLEILSRKFYFREDHG
jgi:hypothetical protein